MELSEKQVQELVADFPWLLNLNYQIVPQIGKKGMEYYVSGKKRIDLILRDSITERPVIVEFKSVPFYRENIGQILEYRARIISELGNEESELYSIFGSQLSSPILILVVPTCTEEARLACNLSGIEVYEYEKSIAEFVQPKKRQSLEEMSNSIKDIPLPITTKRHIAIAKIYNDIAHLISDLKLNTKFGYVKYTGQPYVEALSNFFINKWIFHEQDVSIGIYENIFDKKYEEITIEYFSYDREMLNDFRAEYIKEFKDSAISEIFNEYKTEHYFQHPFSKKDFVENTKETLRPLLLAYVSIMKKVFEIDLVKTE